LVIGRTLPVRRASGEPPRSLVGGPTGGKADIKKGLSRACGPAQGLSESRVDGSSPLMEPGSLLLGVFVGAAAIGAVLIAVLRGRRGHPVQAETLAAVQQAMSAEVGLLQVLVAKLDR